MSCLAPSTEGSSRNSVRDDEFYLNFVVFEVDKFFALSKGLALISDQVEGVLFRVLTDAFETRSKVFCNMYPLPVGVGSSTIGDSDDSPIVLERIKLDDFRAFLRFLYPKYVTGNDLSINEFSLIYVFEKENCRA